MPPSSAAPLPARARRRAGHPLTTLLCLLILAGCAREPLPIAPAPTLPEPEELGEAPELVEREVTAPARDILGDADYDLPVEANSWVEAELDFLVEQRRAVIARWLERGDPYEGYIRQILAEERVPTDLYFVAMIESGFVTSARSRAGAVGIWQFMPATGRGMGLRVDSVVDERMDPVRSTRAAARHLRQLYRIYGDWALAAAAYNAGSGRVSRAMQAFGADNFWDLAHRGDLAAETRHYVPRLYAMTVIGRNRERFGFAPAPAPRPFVYDSMLVEYATPLQELATLGPPTVEELSRHNPHLFRGATPSGPYWVWLPPETGVEMQRAWLASDFRRQRGMGTYVVRSGDSLGRLAQLSGVRSARIRELNPGVNFDRLQIGERLRLPYVAAQQLTERPAAGPALAAASSAGGSSAARSSAGSSGSAAANTAAGAATSAGANAAPVAVAASRSADSAAGPSHTVREGESLWGIARDHGVSVAALQEANALSGSTIRPGQALRIPGGTAPAPAAAEVVEHVVAAGESLWGIARRYGTSIDAIQAANQLGDRPIRPGQKLSVPVGN
jgi:membrane-bound lytic murein transglycosylase D